MATLIVALLLVAGAAAPAQNPSDPKTEEIVERILELQRQIDALMAQLPPEIREQLRERLAQTSPEAGTPAAGTPAAGTPVAGTPAAGTPAAGTPAAGTPVIEPVVVEGTAGEPARAEPAAEPAAPPATEPLPRRRPRREPCNTLAPFDENADGKVSAADRYWRHLYLWTDKNGNRQVEEREVESAYEQGVREIDLSLDTFMRTRGTLGEARVEDRVVLDVRGDGFSDRARRDDGVLMIDATALQRGDGPRLLGPGGETLEGFQPFRAGLAIQIAGGPATALNCPRAD